MFDVWYKCVRVNHDLSCLNVHVYCKIRVTYITVEHAYSEHAYNELSLIVKRFSFPVDCEHIVKLTDITNYIYNEVNLL